MSATTTTVGRGGQKKMRKVSISEEDPEVCMQPLTMKDMQNWSEDFSTGRKDEKPADTEVVVPDVGRVPVPPDGGWGWVVCIAGFLCNMILDGTAYIFGILLPALAKHFRADRSTVAWIGSLFCGMYMLSGPIVGGLINRFGTRPVCISGALVAWAAISLSTFSVNVWMMMIVYGVVGGFGLGLIYLPSVIAVGHYFEAKRALATGIAVCGSGVGTFLFAPLASYLVTNYSWETSNYVFASFFGVCIFCGLTMKPLEIGPVVKQQDVEKLTMKLPGEGKRLTLRLPGEGDKLTLQLPEKKSEMGSKNETDSQRLEESRNLLVANLVSHHPGVPRNHSAVQLTTLRPQKDGGLSASISSALLKRSPSSSLVNASPSPSLNKLANPFQRKDIFYSGSIINLEHCGELVVARNKSFVSIKDGAAGEQFISRTSLFNPPQEEGKRTVLSFLEKMVNPSLLNNNKFLLVSLSNLFGFLGFYVPFMYIPSLVQAKLGSPGKEGAIVLSVIGIFNTVGRVLTGWLADQDWADALILTSSSLVLSAVCVIVFPFVSSYPVFLVLGAVFGVFVAAYISLTSIMLVDLVGLDDLTTAFGLVSMCRGGAAILGPPIAGAVFDATSSFLYSFLMAGGFFAAAGFLSFAAHFLRRRKK